MKGNQSKIKYGETNYLMDVKKLETVKIYFTNPGFLMSHCHIAEHLTGGMMMNFEVKK